MQYGELHCISNFTFLRGASHPEELIRTASERGYKSIAITDECSLSGIVRAHAESKKHDIKLIIGSEIKIQKNLNLVFLVQSKKGYENLSRLITHGRRSAKKGTYHLTRNDICNGIPGCFVLWDPSCKLPTDDAIWLNSIFGKRLWISVKRLAKSDDLKQMNKIIDFSRKLNIPCVATSNVHMHKRNRRKLQDVLTAIRLNSPLPKLGYQLHQNGERYLRSMRKIYSLYPYELIEQTTYISDMCNFTLDELKYNYPKEIVPHRKDAGEHLANLANIGLIKRFKKSNRFPPNTIVKQMNYEISLIRELKYEDYFLTVYDIVMFAKKNNILCQGRGSAANSVVCFALGITEVDPSKSQLLFERFISKERKEPPDIDVDFEHDRREEIIQYIYKKYGRNRAALASAVVTYRANSAIRDVSKALGIDNQKINKLLKIPTHSWWNKDDENDHLKNSGFNLESPCTRNFISITRSLIGFPRHLSQHVGGFVISQEPLSNLVPIENTVVTDNSQLNREHLMTDYPQVNRTIIQWDKNDLDELNILKIDILSLGILAVISRSLAMIRKLERLPFQLEDIPKDDPEVYKMISKADTVGVFQIESRAQMSMLPRLKPKNFYDLIIQIAIVRPGPIQGGMVHPYLRRRQGKENVTYPSPMIKKVLQRTLGVPIFQEQVMQIAITASGFSPGEADQLRRSISGWRSKGSLQKLKKRLTSGMSKRGYNKKFAEKVFNQILGFGEYGFPESHAASFALLVYSSAWLKHYYPEVFLVALLNSQPMGFYAPAQLVQDAKKHQVNIKPADAMISDWDSSIELTADRKTKTVRLGLNLIKGLSKVGAIKLIACREKKQFSSKEEFLSLAQLSMKDMQSLAEADALSFPQSDRRSAIWMVTGIQKINSIFKNLTEKENNVELKKLTEGENIIADYNSIGLTLRSHPLQLIRPQLTEMGIICTNQIDYHIKCKTICTSGIVINRQKPASGKGVLFMTIEDETGFANVIVWPKVAKKYRNPLLLSSLITITGYVQKQDGVINLIASRIEDHSELLGFLKTRSRDFH